MPNAQITAEIVVDIVNGPCGRLGTYPAESGLEVGCRVRTSTRVVVLLEVRLEGRGTVGILGFVTKSGARVEVQVVVVGGHLVLALLHAPKDKRNASKKEGTTDTANHSTDDTLVGIAQATTVISAAILRRWRVGKCSLAGGDGNCAGACRSELDLRSIANGLDDSNKLLD
jgi:hypothetical protein